MSERKVRRELARGGGSYIVPLRGIDRAWNPEPESPLTRGLTLEASPFSGPFTVVHIRQADGHISARSHRHD